MTGDWSNALGTYHVADVLDFLRDQPEASVQCVVTSPPYWGLRDYGVYGAIGLEPTVDAHVERVVEVFREVRRVLRSDGTLWLNLGDAYTGAGSGIKPKDLIGLPWRVAFALQADGWWLRSDIIWHKPNPMPESVTDRPTKAHEYVFLMTKSARYFYDAEAVTEPVSPLTNMRVSQNVADQIGSARANGGTRADRPMKAVLRSPKIQPDNSGGIKNNQSFQDATVLPVHKRNKRSVWTIATQPYPEAHFATFPEKLVEPCVLAGTSAKGCCVECGASWERESSSQIENTQRVHNGKYDPSTGWSATGHLPGRKRVTTLGWRATCDHAAAVEPCVVMDPFMGSGTVAHVAQRLNRRWLGCDLNPEYAELARDRAGTFTQPMDMTQINHVTLKV